MTHTDERVSNLVGGKNNSGKIKFKKTVKVAMVIGGVFFCSYLVNVQTANANLVTPKTDTVIIKHDTFVSNATAETFQKALAIKKTFDYARNILQNAFLIETIKYETDMAHNLPRPNSQTTLVKQAIETLRNKDLDVVDINVPPQNNYTSLEKNFFPIWKVSISEANIKKNYQIVSSQEIAKLIKNVFPSIQIGTEKKQSSGDNEAYYIIVTPTTVAIDNAFTGHADPSGTTLHKTQATNGAQMFPNSNRWDANAYKFYFTKGTGINFQSDINTYTDNTAGISLTSIDLGTTQVSTTKLSPYLLSYDKRNVPGYVSSKITTPWNTDLETVHNTNDPLIAQASSLTADPFQSIPFELFSGTVTPAVNVKYMANTPPKKFTYPTTGDGWNSATHTKIIAENVSVNDNAETNYRVSNRDGNFVGIIPSKTNSSDLDTRYLLLNPPQTPTKEIVVSIPTELSQLAFNRFYIRYTPPSAQPIRRLLMSMDNKDKLVINPKFPTISDDVEDIEQWLNNLPDKNPDYWKKILFDGQNTSFDKLTVTKRLTIKKKLLVSSDAQIKRIITRKIIQDMPIINETPGNVPVNMGYVMTEIEKLYRDFQSVRSRKFREGFYDELKKCALSPASPTPTLKPVEMLCCFEIVTSYGKNCLDCPGCYGVPGSVIVRRWTEPKPDGWSPGFKLAGMSNSQDEEKVLTQQKAKEGEGSCTRNHRTECVECNKQCTAKQYSGRYCNTHTDTITGPCATSCHDVGLYEDGYNCTKYPIGWKPCIERKDN